MLVAMGAEQSEYGGKAVGSTEPTEKGRNGGLLKARKCSSPWISRAARAVNTKGECPDC